MENFLWALKVNFEIMGFGFLSRILNVYRRLRMDDVAENQGVCGDGGVAGTYKLATIKTK